MSEQIKAEVFGTQDEDGWYAWHGGTTMRPAGRVDYITRNGDLQRDYAEGLYWPHSGGKFDIVKWRPAR